MRTLLAIPIFNEEKHLRAVLARVRDYVQEILVVDDGSTDGTAALIEAERGIFKVRHPQNRGYGQSLIAAFTFAQDARFDWLITMDCDEQHEPAHIPEFIAAAGEDDTDLISGSRYLAKWGANGRPPPDRRRINRRITNLLNDVLGLDITDAFCGFKAYRVDALRQLRLTVPGYAMPVQFWVQVARAGFRIRELPVELIYNNPNRHFGGLLDDPDARFQHYLDVFHAELAREPAAPNSGISSVNPVCSGR